jgi:DNA helicase II / ATP-dependent DNA helicase PcrA
LKKIFVPSIGLRTFALKKSQMQTENYYQKSFAAVLSALNPAQRQAVEQIEGPVMVIAGPGTGKTHLLAARIGRILTETDTQSQNILCLTFTDAGVQAMRERLLQLIGPEARRIRIFTFHSFCNSIIHENPDFFGLQNGETLSDLERVEIIREILDGLNPNNPLRKGSVYAYEKQLYDLFQLMKREHWDTQLIENRIKTYFENIVTNDNFLYKISKKGSYKKGDLKESAVAEAREKMDRLLAAAKLYPIFQDVLKSRHRYDFDDMILWVIRAFKTNGFLLRRYQEQYLYFLVDEFQDTNGSQNTLLNLLIQYWINPNIFIVGDDDQAIYEFQGARLRNLSEFFETYRKDLTTVVLKENYRSSQPILDASKHLIDYNKLRIITELHVLNLDKTLKSNRLHDKKLPHIVAYPNRMQEAADIIRQIEEMRDLKIPLSNVAIIYAQHKQAATLMALLEKRNIPYRVKRKVNVLDTKLIQNVRLLLKWLVSEQRQPFSGEHFLFKILNIDFLGLEIDNLSALLSQFVQDKEPNDDAPAFVTKRWRDILIGSKDPKTNQIWIVLKQLLRMVQNTPLLTLLEAVINRTGLLSHISNLPDRLWQMQILYSFFEFVKTEIGRNPRIDLNKLLEILDSMDDNNLSLPIQKTMVDPNGVQLVTAHSAKGLEFEQVFVIDAVAGEWEKSNRGNQHRFSLPDTLTFTQEADVEEARRRMFYVAVTRAKTLLQISFAENDAKDKALVHSTFVDEILAGGQLQIEKRHLSHAIISEYQTALLTETPLPNPILLESQLTDEILKNFQLSVSAMNVYLECPLSFYYEYIVKLPYAVSDSARYGTAMHYALRRIFNERKNEIFPPVEEALKWFKSEMERQRGYFSAKAFDRRLATGRARLQAFYHQKVDTWAAEAWVERRFSTEMDNIPITGAIDKIEFTSPVSVRVIDYKTGKQEEKYLYKPTAKVPNGGKYWRQLAFYKILLEQHQRAAMRVWEGEIAYLEPNGQGQFVSKTVELGGRDVDVMREIIQNVWKGIQTKAFTGCGQASCAWCQFIQNGQTPTVFRNKVLESIDD